MNKSSWLRAMKNRTQDISRVMPDTRPSTPSRRLNEFIVPTINRKIIIAAGMIGNWIPNKVSVEICGIKCMSNIAAAMH